MESRESHARSPCMTATHRRVLDLELELEEEVDLELEVELDLDLRRFVRASLVQFTLQHYFFPFGVWTIRASVRKAENAT